MRYLHEIVNKSRGRSLVLFFTFLLYFLNVQAQELETKENISLSVESYRPKVCDILDLKLILAFTNNSDKTISLPTLIVLSDTLGVGNIQYVFEKIGDTSILFDSFYDPFEKNYNVQVNPKRSYLFRAPITNPNNFSRKGKYRIKFIMPVKGTIYQEISFKETDWIEFEVI